MTRSGANAAIPSALAGVRVIDCTDELGAYGTRLLAALGADVVRLLDSRTARPRDEYDLYFNADKAVATINPANGDDKEAITRLVERADLIVESVDNSPLGAIGLTAERIAAINPRAVHTRIAALGAEGSDSRLQRASDLTLMARGGLMWLAGEPGRPPIRPAGHQSAIAIGLYGVVGSLIALLEAEAAGRGQIVDVSGLEVIVTALENAVQFWDLERTIRKRVGSRPREAGSGLFPCEDGYVYLMAGRLSTPRGWVATVEWLNECGVAGADALLEPAWSEYSFRITPEATARFLEIFGRFAAHRRMADLYEEGQRRGIIVCPLNTALDLLKDPQLRHRRFFVTMDTGSERRQVPRGPFRMSATPLRVPQPARAIDARAIEWAASVPAAERSRANGPRWLSGIRVADFTWVGAGPFATKLLADHGAEVIKIESARRLDALRGMPPYPDRNPGINRSGYFANRNTSKKSVTLNLGDPRGVELARRLIARSDIVANSFTAGTMEKWGLGYEDCRALRHDIIYLSMPMHGGDGPHGRFLGYGAAMSALSGLYAATGYSDGAPTGTGTNYPDHVPNPCHAAVALLAALRHRRRTGQGQSIELSQVESTICALGPLVLAAQSEHENALVRLGNREPGVVPHGVYPAKGDDRWIALACWNDEDWAVLCRMANVGWETDPRFATLPARVANESALDEDIGRWTTERDAFVLAAQLQSAGVDAAPVQHAQDLVERDAWLRDTGHWVRLHHPEMGDCLYDAPPFRLRATPGGLRSPAPLLGEHTDEVLASVLSMAPHEIASLRAAGVLT
jgi:crotonobetainyl-CoA:carnitine CoA-transferase CaiB-like acyl-CoA transferase